MSVRPTRWETVACWLRGIVCPAAGARRALARAAHSRATRRTARLLELLVGTALLLHQAEQHRVGRNEPHARQQSRPQLLIHGLRGRSRIGCQPLGDSMQGVIALPEDRAARLER